MPEIIHIQVGQCGNQIGTTFWEELCKEHDIAPDGRFTGKDPTVIDRADVYFHETKAGRYVPRSVLVDLEPGTMAAMKSGPMGQLFKPDNVIHAANGAGNVWAKGHLTEGPEIAEQILDVIRKEAEATDCLQGFQLVHSIGGGTGSGLGTLLTLELQDEYEDRMLASYSVIPRGTDGVVEPYNAVLSMHHLIENCNEVMCFDNQALTEICTRELKMKTPNYDDMNKLVTRAMTGITASLRFPGQLNSDLRKLAVNLIPFPRLHFFLVGYAPWISSSSRKYASNSVSDLVSSVFDARTMMSKVDPSQGKYMTASVLLQGKVTPKEADEALSNLQLANRDRFIDWIPNSIKSSICRAGVGMNSDASATFLGNSTAISQMFRRVYGQYQKMFATKAFVHKFFDEGMEIGDFEDSAANLLDLIREYESYEKDASNPIDSDDEDQELTEADDSLLEE